MSDSPLFAWWRDEWGEPDPRVRERARASLKGVHFAETSLTTMIGELSKRHRGEHAGHFLECSACMKPLYDVMLAALDSAT